MGELHLNWKNEIQNYPWTKEKKNLTITQIKVILNMPFYIKALHPSLLPGFVSVQKLKEEQRLHLDFPGYPYISEALLPSMNLFISSMIFFILNFRPSEGIKSGPWQLLSPELGNQAAVLYCITADKKSLAERVIHSFLGFTWLWPGSGVCCQVIVVSTCWILDAFGCFLPKLLSAHSWK